MEAPKHCPPAEYCCPEDIPEMALLDKCEGRKAIKRKGNRLLPGLSQIFKTWFFIIHKRCVQVWFELELLTSFPLQWIK